MAFYKKKVEQAAAENVVAFSQLKEALDRKMEEVKAIPDAAERYFGLYDIQAELVSFRKEISNRFHRNSGTGTGPVMGVGNGVGGAGVIAATGFSVFLLGPVGVVTAIAILPVLIGTSIGSDKIEERNEKILNAAAAEFDEYLDLVGLEIASQKTHLLNTSLQQMIVSERFNELNSRFPEVRDAFETAAKRRLLLQMQEDLEAAKPLTKQKPKS